jgi:hypothetical protein
MRKDEEKSQENAKEVQNLKRKIYSDNFLPKRELGCLYIVRENTINMRKHDLKLT